MHTQPDLKSIELARCIKASTRLGHAQLTSWCETDRLPQLSGETRLTSLLAALQATLRCAAWRSLGPALGCLETGAPTLLHLDCALSERPARGSSFTDFQLQWPAQGGHCACKRNSELDYSLHSTASSMLLS